MKPTTKQMELVEEVEYYPETGATFYDLKYGWCNTWHGVHSVIDDSDPEHGSDNARQIFKEGVKPCLCGSCAGTDPLDSNPRWLDSDGTLRWY